jgi:hypothetical protein
LPLQTGHVVVDVWPKRDERKRMRHRKEKKKNTSVRRRRIRKVPSGKKREEREETSFHNDINRNRLNIIANARLAADEASANPEPNIKHHPE